jgi:hypothetical protein
MTVPLGRVDACCDDVVQVSYRIARSHVVKFGGQTGTAFGISRIEICERCEIFKGHGICATKKQAIYLVIAHQLGEPSGCEVSIS